MGLKIEPIRCPSRVDLTIKIPAPIICYRFTFIWWFIRFRKVIKFLVDCKT